MSLETTAPALKSLRSLVVEGGHRLAGQIVVEGNKNSALPLLAGCLLTDQPCVLTNMPRIKDVQVMADLLRGLGASVSGIGTTNLRLCCAKLSSHEPDRALVGRLRGSVLLCGPLLAAPPAVAMISNTVRPCQRRASIRHQREGARV